MKRRFATPCERVRRTRARKSYESITKDRLFYSLGASGKRSSHISASKRVNCKTSGLRKLGFNLKENILKIIYALPLSTFLALPSPAFNLPSPKPLPVLPALTLPSSRPQYTSTKFFVHFRSACTVNPLLLRSCLKVLFDSLRSLLSRQKCAGPENLYRA